MKCCNQDMTNICIAGEPIAYGCDECGSVVIREGFERYAEWARDLWKYVRTEPPENKE